MCCSPFQADGSPHILPHHTYINTPNREWTFLSTLSHPHIVSAKDDAIFRIRNPCRCGGDHAALPDKEHDDVYVIVRACVLRAAYLLHCVFFLRCVLRPPACPPAFELDCWVLVFPDHTDKCTHNNPEKVMERMEMDLYDTMHYFKAYKQSPSRLKLSSFNQLLYSRLPPRMVRGPRQTHIHTHT